MFMKIIHGPLISADIWARKLKHRRTFALGSENLDGRCLLRTEFISQSWGFAIGSR